MLDKTQGHGLHKNLAHAQSQAQAQFSLKAQGLGLYPTPKFHDPVWSSSRHYKAFVRGIG
jgi:hypothetical protein